MVKANITTINSSRSSDNNNNNNNSDSYIGDGSEGSTFSVNGTNGEVTAKAGKQGTPFNLRYHEACRSTFGGGGGDDLFSIRILEASGRLSVGLVAIDEFLPGRKTRGMFYNGNAHNGIGALIGRLGKTPGAGDEVAIRLVRTGRGRLEVEIIVNGRSLGTCFRLEDGQSRKLFYPCVAVSDTATFVFRDKRTTKLGWRTRMGRSTDITKNEEKKTFEGDWRVERVLVDGATIEFPPDHPMTISVRGEPTPTSIGIEVTNTLLAPIRAMRAPVHVTGRGRDFRGGSGALNVTVGPEMLTTLSEPASDLLAIERVVSRALVSFTSMTLVRGDRLHLSGTGLRAPELTARRYTKTFPLVTKY